MLAADNLCISKNLFSYSPGIFLFVSAWFLRFLSSPEPRTRVTEYTVRGVFVFVLGGKQKEKEQKKIREGVWRRGGGNERGCIKPGRGRLRDRLKEGMRRRRRGGGGRGLGWERRSKGKSEKRPPQSNERGTEEIEVKKVEKETERDHPTVKTRGKAADFNIYFSPSTAPLRPTLRLEALLLPSHPSIRVFVCVCVRILAHDRGPRTPVNHGCALLTAFNGEKLYIIQGDATLWVCLSVCASVCVCVPDKSQLLRVKTILSIINTTRKHIFPQRRTQFCHICVNGANNAPSLSLFVWK